MTTTPRARDLGITIGEGTPGPHNAITDVAGVRVGHTTLIAGDGPLVMGKGPVRTGVTVIDPPRRRRLGGAAVRRRGDDERQRRADGPRVGPRVGPAQRPDRHHQHQRRRARCATRSSRPPPPRTTPAPYWVLPGRGRDVRRPPQRHRGRPRPGRARRPPPSRRRAAAACAEGNVGGGTGMICHEFKGGIGTRRAACPATPGGWTVGVLVQANYGRRGCCASTACRSARRSRSTEVPSPWRRRGWGSGQRRAGSGAARVLERGPGAGSIIGIVATDAPLLPHQCERLARRAHLGVARVGGLGSPTSGDLFIASRRGNRGMPPTGGGAGRRRVVSIRALIDRALGYAVRGDGRGDRGGHRQRPRRRGDDDRPRRHHRPPPATRPAGRGHAPPRARIVPQSEGNGSD